MTTRIICLGNRAACTYKNNPPPPPGLPLDKLEVWATMVCQLDIGAVPKVGTVMKNSDGKDDYVVTEQHRAAFLADLIERPVLAAVLTGHKLCTRINVSQSSTLLQAVQECMNCWRGTGHGNGVAQGHGTPAWIAGTDPALVQILAQEMGITEVREYEENH